MPLTSWVEPSEKQVPLYLEILRPHTADCISFVLLCFEAIKLLISAALDLEFTGVYVEVGNHDAGFVAVDGKEENLRECQLLKDVNGR